MLLPKVSGSADLPDRWRARIKTRGAYRIGCWDRLQCEKLLLLLPSFISTSREVLVFGSRPGQDLFINRERKEKSMGSRHLRSLHDSFTSFPQSIVATMADLYVTFRSCLSYKSPACCCSSYRLLMRIPPARSPQKLYWSALFWPPVLHATAGLGNAFLRLPLPNQTNGLIRLDKREMAVPMITNGLCFRYMATVDLYREREKKTSGEWIIR